MADNRSKSLACVLAVGGLDPSGGAGIGLDGAVIRSTGLHPAMVCAVDTCQDGSSFLRGTPSSAKHVVQSMETVLRALDIRSIKIGAMGTGRNIRAVAKVVRGNPGLPTVLDPVAFSTTGGILLDDDGVPALRESLIPACTIVTPNISEAAMLARMPVSTVGQMANAGKVIVQMGAKSVLIKGGHLGGSFAVDVFVTAAGDVVELVADRLDVGEVRGTGCALASFIASKLALGESVLVAVRDARDRLTGAMESACSIGAGPKVLSF